MELPVWHFVGIGSGLIIGIVSVLHVFVAQFAVGGGSIWYGWSGEPTGTAHRRSCNGWSAIRTFFLLLTMVFGGLSGVGIWFTMSVVNPGATSMLIHNFVFFWAAEWGAFPARSGFPAGLLLYLSLEPQRPDEPGNPHAHRHCLCLRGLPVARADQRHHHVHADSRTGAGHRKRVAWLLQPHLLAECGCPPGESV